MKMRRRKVLQDMYYFTYNGAFKAFSGSPSCAVFELSFCQIQDLWGIFWQNDRHFLLVDPMALTSSLLRSESIITLKYCFEEGKEPLYVKVRREETYVEWIFQQEDHCIRSLYFSLEEYADKIKKAIKTLYRHQDLIHCQNTPYDYGEYFLDMIRLCLRQLSVKGLYLPHRIPYTNEVPIEVLSFDIRRDAKGREALFLGFGKRGYHLPLSDWDCSFNGIRHQLEDFVFNQNATIDLGCFDERHDIILKIEERFVLNSEYDRTNEEKILEPEEKTYVLVSIEQREANEDEPVLQAYCNEKQVLLAIYKGLLLFALSQDIDPEEDDEKDQIRLSLYNTIKSPVLENFLLHWCEEDSRYLPDDTGIPAMRQQNIHTILRIEPDCGEFIWFQSEERLPLSAVDDCFETLLDQNGKPIIVEGFSAWQNEIAPVWSDLSDEAIHNFDWAGFHERGTDLAFALREQLPDDVDLWYSAPLFDPSGIVPQPFLVSQY